MLKKYRIFVLENPQEICWLLSYWPILIPILFSSKIKYVSKGPILSGFSGSCIRSDLEVSFGKIFFMKRWNRNNPENWRPKKWLDLLVISDATLYVGLQLSRIWPRRAPLDFDHRKRTSQWFDEWVRLKSRHLRYSQVRDQLYTTPYKNLRFRYDRF